MDDYSPNQPNKVTDGQGFWGVAFVLALIAHWRAVCAFVCVNAVESGADRSGIRRTLDGRRTGSNGRYSAGTGPGAGA